MWNSYLKKSIYKRVTLINSPYYLRGDSTFKHIEGYTIPFGILSLAAVIQRDLPETSVTVVDGRAENLSPAALLDRILKTKPELVGISSFTYCINDTLLLSKWIKKAAPDIKIILGGVHVTQLPDEAIKDDDVDFVIRGEGEYSLRDLIAGHNLDDIKGLVYKDKNNQVRMHPEFGIVDVLDELPAIAYDLVDMSKYYPTAGQCHRFPASAMITSRGCPGRCIYCSSSVSGKKVRYRSAKNIINEIKLLINNYGIKEIVFMDDVFTSNKDRLLEFCQMVHDEKMDIIWDCSSRVQHVDEEVLPIMRRAGCSQLSFGVETGDENVLKSIKKGQTLDHVRKKVRLSKKAGIETRSSFILGFPSDTIESMKKTIDFAIELSPHLVSFYIATPFPGTEMYDWAVKNNKLLTNNWSLYDQQHHILNIPGATSQEIDNMYKLAYKSFYHRPTFILRRLLMLRSLYDIKNAFKAIKMTIKAHAFPDVNFDELEARLNEQYEKAGHILHEVSINK
jgi:anaerobic magnesium-protoporphyrin IX monomethyl ester cyclase